MSFSPRVGSLAAEALGFLRAVWEAEVVPVLEEYIGIPNKSPQFDPKWVEAGHMDRAVALFENWALAQLSEIGGATVEVVQLHKPDGTRRTPVIFIEIPGRGACADDTVLIYGHGDKQPEFEGWDEGLGPWKPVRKGDKLYGRGGADDGYAIFSAVTAIKLNERRGLPRARHVVLIEFCEESGSFDLPAYIDHLAGRIGTPSLVVCLDSGAGDYKRLWLTTSLRGLVGFDLTVAVMRDGVHSGHGSGIVPDLFRVATRLLARLQDSDTGRILCPELFVDVPEDRAAQIARAAQVLGDKIFEEFHLLPGVEPLCDDNVVRLFAGTWAPTLTVTGANGLPTLGNAGNTLPAKLTLRGSLRIPPTLPPAVAVEIVHKVLTQNLDLLHGVHVTVDCHKGSPGWNSSSLEPWLEGALQAASSDYFDEGFCAQGQGGSIPFMAMLGKRFPRAQFFITGVLGPESNAHGPNESLDIDFAERITACVAHVLAAHANRHVVG